MYLFVRLGKIQLSSGPTFHTSTPLPRQQFAMLDGTLSIHLPLLAFWISSLYSSMSPVVLVTFILIRGCLRFRHFSLYYIYRFSALDRNIYAGLATEQSHDTLRGSAQFAENSM